MSRELLRARGFSLEIDVPATVACENREIVLTGRAIRDGQFMSTGEAVTIAIQELEAQAAGASMALQPDGSLTRLTGIRQERA